MIDNNVNVANISVRMYTLACDYYYFLFNKGEGMV